MEDQEIVSVPVPKRLLATVIRAMANAMEEQVVGGRIPSETGRQGSEVDWTNPANFRKIRPFLRPASIAMFDMTSAQPGKLVSFEQIIAKVGCTPVEGRAQLSSLTKVVKREFNVPKGMWPVEIPWNKGEGKTSYVTDEATAKAWKASATPTEL